MEILPRHTYRMCSHFAFPVNKTSDNVEKSEIDKEILKSRPWCFHGKRSTAQRVFSQAFAEKRGNPLKRLAIARTSGAQISETNSNLAG